MNIHIKQAGPDDIPAIEGILLDAVNWLNEMGQPLWRAEDMRWDKLSQSYPIDSFYVAMADGIPCGCMSVTDYDPFFWPDVPQGESLFVHKLAVTRYARRRGVSGALLDFAKQLGARRQASAIRLDCDAARPKQRAVYERHGFVCVEEKKVGVGRVFELAMYVYRL